MRMTWAIPASPIAWGVVGAHQISRVSIRPWPLSIELAAGGGIAGQQLLGFGQRMGLVVF